MWTLKTRKDKNPVDFLLLLEQAVNCTVETAWGAIQHPTTLYLSEYCIRKKYSPENYILLLIKICLKIYALILIFTLLVVFEKRAHSLYKAYLTLLFHSRHLFQSSRKKWVRAASFNHVCNKADHHSIHLFNLVVILWLWSRLGNSCSLYSINGHIKTTQHPR